MSGKKKAFKRAALDVVAAAARNGHSSLEDALDRIRSSRPEGGALTPHQRAKLFEGAAGILNGELEHCLAGGNARAAIRIFESLRNHEQVMAHIRPEHIAGTLALLPQTPATDMDVLRSYHPARAVVDMAESVARLSRRLQETFAQAFAALPENFRRQVIEQADSFGSGAARRLLAGSNGAAPKPAAKPATPAPR